MVTQAWGGKFQGNRTFSRRINAEGQKVVRSAMLKNLGSKLPGGVRRAWHELAVPLEKRDPFLDGLRALAILLVINTHQAAAFALNFGKNHYSTFPVTAAGWAGVDLFFVLSGFFIGTQLWRELAKTGTIEFGRFMIRRGLRIWPLYFFFFAMVTIFWHRAAIGHQHGWSDLVFLTNYFHKGIVGGSWSLCSEEQFYIIAPLTLLLISKRSAKAYRYGLIGLMVVEIVIRSANFYQLTGHLFVRNPDAMQTLYFPLDTHCDGLIAGLLIANLISYTDKIKSKNLPFVAIAGGLLMLVASDKFHLETINFAALAITFGGMVWLSTQRVIPIFNGHIFYVLSRLSFGMYLNHQYMETWIANHVAPILLTHGGPAIATAASCLTLAIFSAALSVVTFVFIESPFLALRTTILQVEIVPVPLVLAAA